MKTNKKNKKMFIILTAIFLIISIVFIVKFVNKRRQNEQTPVEEQEVIQLPETVYNNMEVKNVQMEYLKNNDQTIITMELRNTTQNVLKNEKIEVLWIGPDEKILGKLPNTITELKVGEEVIIQVILKGDLTATQQIKLVKK